jgi:hypothetical protein
VRHLHEPVADVAAPLGVGRLARDGDERGENPRRVAVADGADGELSTDGAHRRSIASPKE